MEYLLGEGADARAALGAHLDVRAGRARTVTTTFYDTFDGRLHGEGVTLRHVDGRLALLDRASGEELASAEAPAARRLFDADLPEALRERLAPVIEMRALLPVAQGPRAAAAARTSSTATPRPSSGSWWRLTTGLAGVSPRAPYAATRPSSSACRTCSPASWR